MCKGEGDTKGKGEQEGVSAEPRDDRETAGGKLGGNLTGVEEGEVGKSEFWDGDERRPGGRMTWCSRRRCRDGDGRRPGGRMNSCGSYGRDYISGEGGLEYITIIGRV